MRIAFVGKGGSGKTTLSSLFARHLARNGKRVWAIDADINQHLDDTLGIPTNAQQTSLADHGAEIRKHVLEGNTLVSSPELIINSTPATRGSTLIRPFELPDFLATAHTQGIDGIEYSRVGDLSEEDISVRCYHAKTSTLELVLNHLIDRDDEFVVCDMTAGVDSFSSSIFAQFDATFLVVEPTMRSVDVLRSYTQYAAPFGIFPLPVGSKVRDNSDIEFLKEKIGDSLITYIPLDEEIRAADRDARPVSCEALSNETNSALTTLMKIVTAIVPDRKKRKEITDAVHRKNARIWGSARKGTDLAEHIDETFVPTP
jgi:CO dehydrogenase maturation factor